MKTLFKSLSAAALLAAALATAAEAKVVASTYYAPVQTGDSKVALLMRTGSNSKFFKLSAKAKVSVSVSAVCAVTVDSAPGSEYSLKIEVHIDGSNVTQTADRIFCTGNETAALDGRTSAAFSFTKTLAAGNHSIQVFANPVSALTLNTDYLISNLSVIVEN
jgi:hypothetical protein